MTDRGVIGVAAIAATVALVWHGANAWAVVVAILTVLWLLIGENL